MARKVKQKLRPSCSQARWRGRHMQALTIALPASLPPTTSQATFLPPPTPCWPAARPSRVRAAIGPLDRNSMSLASCNSPRLLYSSLMICRKPGRHFESRPGVNGGTRDMTLASMRLVQKIIRGKSISRCRDFVENFGSACCHPTLFRS